MKLYGQPQDLTALTNDALSRRVRHEFATHPIGKVLEALRSLQGERGLEGLGSPQQGSDGLSLLDAEAHSSRGASELSPPQPLPETAAELTSTVPAIRKGERRGLIAWAKANGKERSASDFAAKWAAQGSLGGMEHKVYFDPTSNRWFKRTEGSLNSTWTEYLQRLRFHNVLFPESAYRLEGVQTEPNGRFWVEVSQPDVPEDKTVNKLSESEVDAFMGGAGFSRVKGTPPMADRIAMAADIPSWVPLPTGIHYGAGA